MADGPGTPRITGTTSPSSPTRTASLRATMPATFAKLAQPFRFMDLPTELRIQIYEHIVVVGKVFFCADGSSDHDLSFDAYHRPSLSILRVSKEVHNEAEEVYLTKNLFVLPNRFQERMPYTREGSASTRLYDIIPGPLFSEKGLQIIKHIHVNVSADYLPLMPSCLWAIGNPGHFNGMTQTQRYMEKYYLARAQAREEVSDSIGALCNEMSALTTVQLNFTRAYCPIGCCRDINVCQLEVVVLLSSMKSIRVIGLRNQDEQNEFMQSWSVSLRRWHDFDDGSDPAWPKITPGTVEELRERHEVTFGEEGDRWSQWEKRSV